MAELLNTTTHTQKLQEEEYFLPYHWLFRKGARQVQQNKMKLVASMLAAQLPAGGAVLDLGCGDGKHTFDLQQLLGNRFAFRGVDYSDRAIQFARMLAPGISFEVQHAGKTQFADAGFDAIISIEVIEHIPVNEVGVFLQEINRLLKPGGTLVLTTPTPNRPLDAKHFQHFDEALLTNLLQRNGFAVKEVKGFGLALPRWADKCYRYLIDLPTMWRLQPRIQGRTLAVQKATCILVSAVKL